LSLYTKLRQTANKNNTIIP